jgi:hypothetical protein
MLNRLDIEKALSRYIEEFSETQLGTKKLVDGIGRFHYYTCNNSPSTLTTLSHVEFEVKDVPNFCSHCGHPYPNHYCGCKS